MYTLATIITLGKMKGHDTVIISYTDYRAEQDFSRAEEPLPPEISQSNETSSHLDPKANIELPILDRIPILFKQWKNVALATLKRRREYVKRNFLKDFFLGNTFKYPFIVCDKKSHY